ncbi:glycosyltransferase [Streptomyces kaempferi]
MARAVGSQAAYGREVEQALRPHLDWADTVFVDWCSLGAAFVTLVDPGTTRVIVRLHSFEAFSYWPHIMDFSRVDDLVFVGAHVRDLTTAAVPRLLAEDAPRLSVIPNAMELFSYRRPKHPDARFTLGLVGIGQIAKDPRWAVEVLRLLRRHDDRYRLLLVGGDLNTESSPAVRLYHDRLERDLAKLEPSGAVRRVGQTDDVPGVLEEIGTILSTSVRESFHCALVEGAASGAVPVVRDWPFFADADNGARTLFPRSGSSARRRRRPGGSSRSPPPRRPG